MPKFVPTTSDEAVIKATGKNWNQWFQILDKQKAHTLNHTQIAQLVYTIAKVRWWSQMVANNYEQYKGLRKKYENSQGFEASVSKTIDKPVGQLYHWWKKFPGIKVTSATPNKYVRGIVKKDRTRIDVGFYIKGKNKTQVAVQLHKLKNAAAVKQTKAYWGKILGQLINN
jgi:hypothetical protein